MKRTRNCAELLELPCGVTIEVTCASALLLQSELRAALDGGAADVAPDVDLVCHAIESLLLAQAAAGVDLREPAAA